VPVGVPVRAIVFGDLNGREQRRVAVEDTKRRHETKLTVNHARPELNNNTGG
jgi:hypothetical protein